MIGFRLIIAALILGCIEKALCSGDWEFEAVFHVEDTSEVFTLNFAKVSDTSQQIHFMIIDVIISTLYKRSSNSACILLLTH